MKWAFRTFLALYLVALALFGVSALGLFGQERDPLGAAFLLPLGLPWVLAADWFGAASGYFVVLAPAINLGLLYWLWKRQG